MASLPGQRAGSIPVGPTIPGALSAIIVPGGVQLSWSASQDGDVPLAYIISRCSGAGCSNFTSLNTTPNGASSYTDQTVASFTSYTYTVRAVDASGNTSGFSNTATVVTPDVTAPTTPVVGSTNTATSITLTWPVSTDPDDPVAQYNVSRSINSAPFAQLASITTNTFTDSTLASGTYQYFVTAQDSNGNISPPSNVITVILQDTTPPTVPTGLSAVGISGSQINLSWNASTDNSGIVNHYNIVRNGVAVATSVTTSFSDTGLSNFTTYAYQVSASDTSNNTSALCPAVNGTTLDTIAPTVPGNFTAVAVSSSEIDLTWTASSDSGSGVASYTITRNPGSFTFQVSSSILSFKDLGLSSVTNYSYSLSATDNAGNSSVTTSASATTLSSSASSFNPNFPRVGFMGIGSTSTLNQYNNVGGLLNLYGRYNIFCFGGDFEAWNVNANGGDRDIMINTVKTNSTANLGTKVLIYGKMNSYLPGDTTYQTWQNVMLNSNFPLYLSFASGTIAVEQGGGKNLIDYAESAVGTAYAGTTTGIGQAWTPAQYSAYYQYYYKLNKTRTGTIPSLFSAISPLDASPKFDGIQMDNFFLDPGVAADWKRNGTQSTFDNGSYQGTFSDILINGQRDFMNTLSSLITAGGGTQWLCANAGGYGRADAGVTLANTGVMKGVLNYSFFEGAIGKNFAIETFRSYADLQNNTAQIFAFLKDPFAVMHNHCLPNGTATQSGNLPWSATKTAVNGEYQWARYMITASLQSNSYCSIQYQTSGYNAEITDLTWYDEYDNAGTLKGYLGQPVDAVQTTIRTWYDGTTVANVWAREFQNGIAISVARTGIGSAITQPTGTITITAAQLGIGANRNWKFINGTQAPAVNTGANVTASGVTLQASRDGIILLKVPNAPTNLIATVISSSQINLSWTASVELGGSISSYTVFRNGTQIATVSSGTTFNDTGLTPNTTYSYQVFGVNPLNISSAGSNTASGTTQNSSTGFLPAGHWVQSTIPLTIIAPVAGLNTGNRYYKQYPGIAYNVPVVAHGGAYPYVYSITGPSGMTIGQTVGSANYGIINWANPVAGTYTCTVTVTDQANVSTSVTWTLTVATTGFIFCDSVNGNDANAGTLAAPFKTLAGWYKSSKNDTTFSGFFVYYQSGTYSTADVGAALEANGANPTPPPTTALRCVMGSPKPLVMMAIPGASVTLNVGTAGFSYYNGTRNNMWLSGISFGPPSNGGNGRALEWDAGNTDIMFYNNSWATPTDAVVSGNNNAIIMNRANGVNNNTVRTCFINNNFQGCNGWDVFLGYNMDQCVFDVNTISNSNGNGIYLKEGSSNGHNSNYTIRNSSGLIGNSGRGFINLDAYGVCDRVDICYNNVKSSNSGILFGPDTGTSITNIFSYRNTWQVTNQFIDPAIPVSGLTVTNDVLQYTTSTANSHGYVVQGTLTGGSFTGEECVALNGAFVDVNGNLTGASRTNFLGLRGHEIA